MPAFLDPFPGRIPDRPLTTNELIRALRQDMAAELEAVHLYNAQADGLSEIMFPGVKEVLNDIADEERVHVGEFLRLIESLDGNETTLIREGREEAEKKAELPKIGYAPMAARG